MTKPLLYVERKNVSVDAARRRRRINDDPGY
jgi:hypothetical protein